MASESDIRLHRSALKLTCWKCGRYAVDVSVSGRGLIKTNCKSANCQHVVCYEVAGSNQDTLDHTARVLDALQNKYGIELPKESAVLARELCVDLEVDLRPGDLCEVRRQWLEPKPVLF